MAQLMGWGEAAAPSAENWNSSRGAGLPTPHSANASLIPAHTGEPTGLQLRSAATKHNKVWTEFIQERWGCSSLEITEAAAKTLASWAWITLLVLLGRATTNWVLFLQSW